MHSYPQLYHVSLITAFAAYNSYISYVTFGEGSD
jgi:hypothetical protein